MSEEAAEKPGTVTSVPARCHTGSVAISPLSFSAQVLQLFSAFCRPFSDPP
jgi:hypothetical protein